jgi:hypothetical protein
VSSEWSRKFREGFTGNREEPTNKPKKSYKERLEDRLANMTPEERKERQRKIDSQNSYEDGGFMCENDKRNKIEALSKLSKSKGKRK